LSVVFTLGSFLQCPHEIKQLNENILNTIK
jgi:hypothetical protein